MLSMRSEVGTECVETPVCVGHISPESVTSWMGMSTWGVRVYRTEMAGALFNKSDVGYFGTS